MEKFKSVASAGAHIGVHTWSHNYSELMGSRLLSLIYLHPYLSYLAYPRPTTAICSPILLPSIPYPPSCTITDCSSVFLLTLYLPHLFLSPSYR